MTRVHTLFSALCIFLAGCHRQSEPPEPYAPGICPVTIAALKSTYAGQNTVVPLTGTGDTLCIEGTVTATIGKMACIEDSTSAIALMADDALTAGQRVSLHLNGIDTDGRNGDMVLGRLTPADTLRRRIHILGHSGKTAPTPISIEEILATSAPRDRLMLCHRLVAIDRCAIDGQDLVSVNGTRLPAAGDTGRPEGRGLVEGIVQLRHGDWAVNVTSFSGFTSPPAVEPEPDLPPDLPQTLWPAETLVPGMKAAFWADGNVAAEMRTDTEYTYIYTSASRMSPNGSIDVPDDWLFTLIPQDSLWAIATSAGHYLHIAADDGIPFPGVSLSPAIPDGDDSYLWHIDILADGTAKVANALYGTTMRYVAPYKAFVLSDDAGVGMPPIIYGENLREKSFFRKFARQYTHFSERN